MLAQDVPGGVVREVEVVDQPLGLRALSGAWWAEEYQVELRHKRRASLSRVAALGLAVLATLSTNRTSELVGAGQSAVSALSDGYHFAWAVGAALVIVSIVLTATVLRSQTADQPQPSVELEEASA